MSNVNIEAEYSHDGHAAHPKGCYVLLCPLGPIWYRRPKGGDLLSTSQADVCNLYSRARAL